MSNYICRYPDGVAGLGLLVIRLGYALAAFGVVAIPPADFVGDTLPRLVAGLIALSLSIGLAARWAALFLGIAVAVALAGVDHGQKMLLAGHVAGCALIVLVGPGAFSIDARRHGRRVIHLQTTPPDRGADD